MFYLFDLNQLGQFLYLSVFFKVCLIATIWTIKRFLKISQEFIKIEIEFIDFN